LALRHIDRQSGRISRRISRLRNNPALARPAAYFKRIDN
jgi:hypothetical protein